jgi:hypothetical protein
VGTKPWGHPRECRQGGSAMNHREEARSHSQAGWRFGRSEGRASCANAKSVLSAPFQKGPAVAKAVTDSQLVPVLHAVMPGLQRVLITGELSQPLGLNHRVRASYKLAMKGQPDALATGTASHRPCPQRTQQRQSSPTTRDERPYHPRSVHPSVVFGKVSPSAAATSWPARTSSWQPVLRLRNIPRHGSQILRPRLID